MPHDRFMERTREVGWFTQESIDFQEKLLYRTGLGNETYFPPGMKWEQEGRKGGREVRESDAVGDSRRASVTRLEEGVIVGVRGRSSRFAVYIY